MRTRQVALQTSPSCCCCCFPSLRTHHHHAMAHPPHYPSLIVIVFASSATLSSWPHLHLHARHHDLDARRNCVRCCSLLCFGRRIYIKRAKCNESSPLAMNKWQRQHQQQPERGEPAASLGEPSQVRRDGIGRRLTRHTFIPIAWLSSTSPS